MIPHQRVAPAEKREYVPRHHSPYSPRHLHETDVTQYQPRHSQDEVPTVELPATRGNPAGRWFRVALWAWIACGVLALVLGVVAAATLDAHELVAPTALVWPVGGIGVLLIRRIERDS